MLPVPPALAKALARARPRLGGLAADVEHHARVGSTNDVAAERAGRGAADGTLIVADAQTTGRGRRGRAWFSPPGAGLYASVVLRPEGERSRGLLTIAAGVALAEAVREHTGLGVDLKWPNDLVVPVRPPPVEGGARWRKVGGILAEAASTGGAPQHVILGFGLNVARAALPPDLAGTATSLEAETGAAPDRWLLLADCLAALARVRDDLRAARFDAILARWRALAPSSGGAPVRWTGPGGARAGVTDGIDPEGALLVRSGSRVERIVGGEVEWL
jgi:BirA family biotin operon repressor/biotin-[acetyl-CoA-carboxylase] ligase